MQFMRSKFHRISIDEIYEQQEREEAEKTGFNLGCIWILNEELSSDLLVRATDYSQSVFLDAIENLYTLSSHQKEMIERWISRPPEAHSSLFYAAFPLGASNERDFLIEDLKEGISTADETKERINNYIQGELND